MLPSLCNSHPMIVIESLMVMRISHLHFLFYQSICTLDAFYANIYNIHTFLIAIVKIPCRQVARLPCDSSKRRDTSLVRLSSSDLAIQRSTKWRNAIYPTKTRTVPFPTLRSTAPPTFADFQDYACQSLKGANSLAKGTVLSMVESAQGGWICQVRTHNLCDRGRPLVVIGRSIHVIPTVLADDQGKVQPA